MPRLAMIGWGPAGAVEALRNLDTQIVVILESLPHVPVVDSSAIQLVRVENPLDIDEVLPRLQGMQLDSVATAHEREMVIASVVASALGVRGLRPRTAVLLRDKYLQKTVLRDAGVRVANWTLSESIDSEVPWPRYVLKPRNGVGSRGVYLGNQAMDRLTADLPWKRPGVLIEEFIDGPEYHADAVVVDGRLKTFLVSKYFVNVALAARTGFRGSALIDEQQHNTLISDVRAIAQSSVTALGHVNGVIHLEFFLCNNQIIVGEIAGRPAGGLIVEMIKHGAGVDIFDAWAHSVLGLPPKKTENSRSHSSTGWVELTYPEGTIVGTPDKSQILSQPGVVSVFETANPLGQLANPSLGRVAARVLIEAPTFAAVEQLARRCAEWFRRDSARKGPGPALGAQ